jgi:hypothetical protein
MFGDDALERPLSTGREQVVTLAIEFIAELNAAMGIISDQILQHGSALRERFLSKVFAVEVQKIEGVKDDAMGLSPNGGP